MGILDYFRRPLPIRAEVKSAVPAPVNLQMANAGADPFGITPIEITPFQATLFYKRVAPLAKVVDLIADHAAGLKTIVKIDGKLDDDERSDLCQKLLRRPGRNRTQRQLIKELAVEYLVTGTAYPHIIGNVGYAPLAIDILKSQTVSFTPGADMWPDQYLYSEGTRSIIFNRDDNARDPRWIDRAGLGEVVPIYDTDGNRRGVGLSRLNAVVADTELRALGIQHNTAMLNNGARMSGVLAFKDRLDDDQRADLEMQMRQKHQGVRNAGGIMVTDGGDMNFQQMSQNMKDMDFAKLLAHAEDAIVARYNVPVTLFRPEAQTNNNYQTAWFMLYENSVLPCFNAIYAPLAQLFSERFGVEITIEHDTLSNSVLAQQASSRARELFNGHIISRNEARAIIGHPPCLGGDTIYGAMGEVPVAEDYFTDHGLNAPEGLTAEAYHTMRNAKLPEGGAPADHPNTVAAVSAATQQQPAANPAPAKPASSADKKRLALVH